MKPLQLYFTGGIYPLAQSLRCDRPRAAPGRPRVDRGPAALPRLHLVHLDCERDLLDRLRRGWGTNLRSQSRSATDN